MIYRAQGFVDGAYVRELAKECAGEGEPILPKPASLITFAAGAAAVSDWIPRPALLAGGIHVQRTTYYDGRREKESEDDARLLQYWKAIELLEDTQLGFGMVRGKKRPRQKAVDTLLATDLLVGAFTGTFEIAILVAGDQDFVPVVIEAKRQGVMVVVMAEENSLGDELRRAADRVLLFSPGQVFTQCRLRVSGGDGQTLADDNGTEEDASE